VLPGTQQLQGSAGGIYFALCTTVLSASIVFGHAVQEVVSHFTFAMMLRQTASGNSDDWLVRALACLLKCDACNR
jgi:hypothetical protein